MSRLDEAEQILHELESVERKLGQLQEGLMRSHRLATLGTMASIIAHEFNNILTPVISYCQLARQRPEDTALLRKALDKALHGAQHAAEISSSMLGFTRLDDGEVRCRVADAVDDAFACLGRPPQRDGIELELNIQEDCEAAISPLNLQQVILNLVLNARRAMRTGGGKLRISAETRNHRVVLQVADTGCGIPPDLLPSIFEPFVTRRSEDDGEEAGTGLGLAICRDLITGAGGEIRVARSDSTGTTFRIELPAADTSAGHQASSSPDRRSATRRERSAGSPGHDDDERFHAA